MGEMLSNVAASCGLLLVSVGALVVGMLSRRRY